MCGRLNVTDDHFVQLLLEGLEVDNAPALHTSPFITPCRQLSILVEQNGRRQLKDATWWLLLEAAGDGFKPSRYTSFNTRYDKLHLPRSAGYRPFRTARCVVVASGFGETEFHNKKPLHYHDMRAIDGAIAFGGLYKTWRQRETGELSYSCSIITNPPHPRLAAIHSKASPLMLPQDDDTLAAWLDPGNHQVAMFDDLLRPALRCDLAVQAIDKPSLRNAVGAPWVIYQDSNSVI